MKVGFIGLGNMGYGMASNLIKNGYKPYLFDVEKSKIDTLVALGGIPSSNITDSTNNAEVVILCLPHPKISSDVIFGKDGIVNTTNFKGKTIIETSTLTPRLVLDFEKKLEELSINFLSAPMLGGQSSANSGTIHFIIEGDQKLLPKYKQLLLSMGSKVTYLGEIPQATIAKLARNMCRFANVATAIEVIDFLHKTTKYIKPIYELLVEESKANFDKVWEQAMTDYALKGKQYVASKISVKDLKLSLGIAKKYKLKMPVTEVTKKVHQYMLKKN